jgi:hypothetical protein
VKGDRVLRILALVAIVAAAAWGAYWFVGARALDRTVAQLLADNPAVTAEAHSVQGFPNRFDLTLTRPQLQAGSLQWQAPFVQVLALSYRPNHVIMVFPHDQQASINGHQAMLHSANARASLVAARDVDLPLERVVLVLQNPQLQFDGATHQAEAVRAASRAVDAQLHEAVVEIDSALPDPALMAALDPEGNWPRRFDVLRLEAEVRFDRPLSRLALAGPLPRVTSVLLTNARMHFEGVDIVATGQVEPDAAGRLSGPVTLTVTGWPALLQRLAASGLIDPDQAGFLRPMLASMAAPDSPDRIEIELTLRDGALAAGPLTLARVPPLF